MADVVDLAADLEAEHLARGLAAARVPVPVGSAGKCDNCGDHFERLVGGRCGFCRDGRLPRFDRPPPEPDDEPETIAMPTAAAPPASAPAKVQINITLGPGTVLTAIQRRACGGPLGPAARDLLGELLARPAEASPETPALADVHLDALLGEVRLRFERAGDRAAEIAANQRAADAEDELAKVRQRLAQVKAAIGG